MIRLVASDLDGTLLTVTAGLPKKIEKPLPGFRKMISNSSLIQEENIRTSWISPQKPI